MNEIKFDGFPDALDALVREVKAHKFDPNERYIVLTPDRYTQSVETALFAGGGSIDTEVLTLSRLAYRVAPQEKTLSREGGVMIAARAIAAVADRLGYYGRATGFNDFARDVYETLGQISSSDVDIYALADTGKKDATSAKLKDLALIKREYDAIKSECSDPADRIAALILAAPSSELIKSSHIYAVGFSDITRLNARALGTVAACARSFKMFGALPPRGARERMISVSAADRISEYKHIACDVIDYVTSSPNAKYSDVYIVCAAPKALERILSEYDIPMYRDETKPFGSTKAAAAIDLITELSAVFRTGQAIDCSALVSLCKNPYCGCDDEDAETLQNAIAVRDLKYVPVSYDFKKIGGEKSAARAISLAKRFAGNENFAAAVDDIVEYAEFEKISAGRQPSTDVIAPIRALTVLLARYGSGSFDKDAKAFKAATRAVNVNSLPRERDCVTVTMPDALRLTKCKRLYVADFNEGVLPETVSPGGLFGDDELKNLNGAIEPSVAQRNRHVRDELRAVVLNAEHVVCAYSTAGGAKPSSFIPELASDITAVDLTEVFDVLKHTADARLISFYAPTRGAARELSARGLTEYDECLKAVGGDAEHIAAEFEPSIGKREKSFISVSELSDWFGCPYKRFLSYSIGLNERRRGLSAPDFGTVVHEFMKSFVDGGVYDCSRETVEQTVDRILTDKGIEPSPTERERIIDAAVDFAAANAMIIERGAYKRFATEQRFVLENAFSDGNSGVDFVGTIDRLDINGGKARIIDYKTGATEFELKKCLDGRDMQLPLYAYAVSKGAISTELNDADAHSERGYDVTGMFYVRLADKYRTDTKRALSGCMLKDVSTAFEYDDALVPGGESSSIIPVKLKADKNGIVSFSGRVSSALMEKSELDKLAEKCVKNASVAVREMKDGFIGRSPADGACTYCPYVGVCIGDVLPRSADVSDDGDM